MVNKSDPVEIVARLLAIYKEQHPWQERAEHRDDQGFSTDLYYQDALAYSQAASVWLQNAAKEHHITVQTYRAANSRLINDDHVCDLLMDGKKLMTSDYPSCYEHMLHSMQNHDLYCEDASATILPRTGHQMRLSYNQQQRYYAQGGICLPKYSYGPGLFTSEKQNSSV